MPKSPFVNSLVERRYESKGSNIPEDSSRLDGTRPLSLTAGPALSWLNLIGNAEAIQITESWRPRFTIRAASSSEAEAWL